MNKTPAQINALMEHNREELNKTSYTIKTLVEALQGESNRGTVAATEYLTRAQEYKTAFDRHEESIMKKGSELQALVTILIADPGRDQTEFKKEVAKMLQLYADFFPLAVSLDRLGIEIQKDERLKGVIGTISLDSTSDTAPPILTQGYPAVDKPREYYRFARPLALVSWLSTKCATKKIFEDLREFVGASLYLVAGNGLQRPVRIQASFTPGYAHVPMFPDTTLGYLLELKVRPEEASDDDETEMEFSRCFITVEMDDKLVRLYKDFNKVPAGQGFIDFVENSKAHI